MLQASGATGGFNQGGKRSWRWPTGHCRGPICQSSKML